jgi:hypothetical protein
MMITTTSALDDSCNSTLTTVCHGPANYLGSGQLLLNDLPTDTAKVDSLETAFE